MTDEAALSRGARIALRVDCVLGALLLLPGMLALGLWTMPSRDPHGGVYVLMVAAWSLAGAALFLLSAWSIRSRDPHWWVPQCFALLYAGVWGWLLVPA